jgi:hypothetical protein
MNGHAVSTWCRVANNRGPNIQQEPGVIGKLLGTNEKNYL